MIIHIPKFIVYDIQKCILILTFHSVLGTLLGKGLFLTLQDEAFGSSLFNMTLSVPHSHFDIKSLPLKLAQFTYR